VAAKSERMDICQLLYLEIPLKGDAAYSGRFYQSLLRWSAPGAAVLAGGTPKQRKWRIPSRKRDGAVLLLTVEPTRSASVPNVKSRYGYSSYRSFIYHKTPKPFELRCQPYNSLPYLVSVMQGLQNRSHIYTLRTCIGLFALVT
jgi:hypothetical protein